MRSRSTTIDTVRVVHLPARTPYAWKLHNRDLKIVNGSTLQDGRVVPADVTATWLLGHRPFSWFDVLHLHHIELEELETLERLLDACDAARIRVVHTAHDVHAIFRSDEELHKRLRLLASTTANWVCLTPGSAATLTKIVGRNVNSAIIPHGYVADPDLLEGKQRNPAIGHRRSLLFGAARPNRDQLSTVVNWSLSTEDPKHELQLLIRGFGPAHFSDPSNQISRLIDAIRADPRIKTAMRSYPTDQEVIEAGLAADALLLPYLWSSHSGQLELAFDLNILPICSSVGYFHEQREQHGSLVSEPEWFDWTHGNPYLFGERFVAALERATERLARGTRRLDRDFIEYRRSEHEQILDRYTSISG